MELAMVSALEQNVHWDLLIPMGKESRLQSLSKVLKHDFKDKNLLEQAVTHSSAKNTHKHVYERLEFLGDRVLGLVLADVLCARYPKENEGALAKRHASLVRKDALAAVARNHSLGEFLILSKGEQESGGRENASLLSDMCEALIGALYLDGGLEAAKAFIIPAWEEQLAEQVRPPQDAKTRLQEWAQAGGNPLPKYRMISMEGPSHDPLFTIEVAIQNLPPEQGSGKSKRLAEQNAAATMLSQLGVK